MTHTPAPLCFPAGLGPHNHSTVSSNRNLSLSLPFDFYLLLTPRRFSPGGAHRVYTNEKFHKFCTLVSATTVFALVEVGEKLPRIWPFISLHNYLQDPVIGLVVQW
jgi:hypothetical protein